MFYIVGLGNPGSQYTYTRHNLGWLALDVLVENSDCSEPILLKKYSGRVGEGVIGESPVTFFYPETYMNNSGLAVRKLVPKGEEGKLILIYDDVDLAQGAIKVSRGNGAGGHNGVTSVISSLGTKDFIRVRLGISRVGEETGKVVRPTGEELATYVLGKATPEERDIYKEALREVPLVIETILLDGVEKAMNRWN